MVEKNTLLNHQHQLQVHISKKFLVWFDESLLELALLGKLIQRGSESNVNKVLTRDGNSSVNLASQGHCAGVFIGA